MTLFPRLFDPIPFIINLKMKLQNYLKCTKVQIVQKDICGENGNSECGSRFHKGFVLCAF